MKGFFSTIILPVPLLTPGGSRPHEQGPRGAAGLGLKHLSAKQIKMCEKWVKKNGEKF